MYYCAYSNEDHTNKVYYDLCLAEEKCKKDYPDDCVGESLCYQEFNCALKLYTDEVSSTDFCERKEYCR